MTDFEMLELQIQRTQRALWLKNIIQQIGRYGFYGACGSIGLVALSKLVPLAALTGLIPLFSGICYAVVVSAFRRPSLKNTALFLDHTLHLENRMATVLEVQSKNNPLAEMLVADTAQFKDKLQSTRIYQSLNMNYFFQFLLAGLVIVIIWLIPSDTSEARGFDNVTQEASAKLRNTAQDISRVNQLDGITQRLVNETARLARLIESAQIPPEEMLSQLENLSRQVQNQLAHKQTGENLFYQIAHLLGKKSPTEGALTTPEQVQNTLQELAKAIKQGTLTMDLASTLKEILKTASAALADDENLKQYIEESLATDNNCTEPLTKFFETLARQNWEVLERLRTRLELARQEITRGLVRYQPAASTNRHSVYPDNFSRANGNNLVPLHPTTTGSPSAVAPVTSSADEVRITQIKELIKKRAAALAKPVWPAEYHKIIKQYFSE